MFPNSTIWIRNCINWYISFMLSFLKEVSMLDFLDKLGIYLVILWLSCVASHFILGV